MPSAFVAAAEESQTDIWAVGNWTNLAGYDHPPEPLAEHWNGNAWTTQTLAPLPQGTTNGALVGVSADAPNDVWAVGTYGTNTSFSALIEHWDGSSWSLVQGLAANQDPMAVYAASPTDVWVTSAGIGGQDGSVEQWNGSSWITNAPSLPIADDQIEYTSISAIPGQVWVGGLYVDSTSNEHGVAAYLDSSGWHVTPDPGIRPSTDQNDVSVIDAVAVNDVWITGTTDVGATSPVLVAQWNGATWTKANLPVPTGILLMRPTGMASGFEGLHITGNEYDDDSNGTAFADTWNGSTWSPDSFPAPTGQSVTAGALVADSASVMMVGAFGATSPGPPGTYTPPPATAFYQLSASGWTFGEGLFADIPGEAALSGIYVAGPTDVWTVGLWANYLSSYDFALIQHWDGSGWETMQPFTTDGLLYGVDGTSTSDVWAVGVQKESIEPPDVIIEHWNGSTWTNENDVQQGVLESVAAVTANDALAVGYLLNGTQYSAISEVWDGTAWSPVTASGTGTVLNGVSALSSTDAWAAGTTLAAGSAPDAALIERWNGTTWQAAAAPQVPGATGTDLYGIDAVADNNVWAVGDYFDSRGAQHTLAEHWNGLAWTQYVTADGPDTSNQLDSVSVTGSAVLVAGSSSSTTPAATGLAESLENGAFVSVASQGSPDGTAELAAVAATPTASWVVGSSVLGQFPLAESACSLPAISGVAPTGGLVTGGQTVTVTGSGFQTGMTATIGGVAVTPTVLSGTTFTFVTPAEAAGTVQVQVTTPEGSSLLTPNDDFTYGSQPVVDSVTPSAGPASGGQTVTVEGSGFTAGMSVTIGGKSVSLSGVTATSFRFLTPGETPGYAQVQVTTVAGVSSLTADAGYIFSALGSYVPLTPFRILDTRARSCIECSTGSLGAGQTRVVQVTGLSGLRGGADPVPPDATAVVLNVTAVNGTVASLLTVSPEGTSAPHASDLNFAAHANVANLVTVALGQSGASDAQREVNIFNALGSVDVLADVEGYFVPQAAANADGEFHSIPPLRVCDTRAGESVNSCNAGHSADNRLGQGQSVKVNVTGIPTGVHGSPASIPSDGTAGAVVLNLTAIAGTQTTWMSVTPTLSNGSCTPSPPTSNINVLASVVQANRVVVQLGPASSGEPDTDVCVYNAVGTINIALDAGGWFGSSAAGAPMGSQYQAIGPTRICDTRSGTGTPCSGSELTKGATLLVSVAGVGGIPASGPLAIVGNLTAVSGSQTTYLTAYPADVSPRPNASDLNVSSGVTLPNLIVVGLASASHAGDIDVFNALGDINAVIDVDGWFQ